VMRPATPTTSASSAAAINNLLPVLPASYGTAPSRHYPPLRGRTGSSDGLRLIGSSACRASTWGGKDTSINGTNWQRLEGPLQRHGGRGAGSRTSADLAVTRSWPDHRVAWTMSSTTCAFRGAPGRRLSHSCHYFIPR
jgi:hypothetical protein